MRKHFLILMLLTLLPLASWAEIGKVANFTYDGAAHQLFDEAGDGSTYFVGTDAELPATPTWKTYANIGDLQKTDAGTYYLWYKTGDADPVSLGAVTIAPINISSGWEVVFSGVTEATYNARHQAIASAASIKKTGTATEADVTNATNWTVAWTFNGAAYDPEGTAVTKAGTYTVTVAPKEANVNYEGSVTKNFTVAKAQLDITAKNVTITYGDALPSISAFYDASGWQNNGATTPVYDDEESEGVVPVTLQTALSNTPVQTTSYTLLANELPNYYINFAQATATYAVSAKAVTVTPNWVAGTYAYGDNLPAITANFTPLAFTDQPSVLGTPTAVFYKYETPAATDLPANPEKLTVMSDAGKYLVTFEGLNNNANYNVTIDTRDFTINQKALTEDMFTLKSGDATFDATYDGAQHYPTVAIAAGKTAPTVFTVEYYKGTTLLPVATETNFVAAADDYKVKIIAPDGGNFSGYVEKPFTIKRKPASLRTVGRDAQPYSGEVYSTSFSEEKYCLTNTANLYWDGIVNGDLNATTNLLNNMGGATIALALYDGENPLTNGAVLQAKNYTVMATIGVVTAVEGVYPMGNYDVTLGNIGKVKIAKKPVTITAKKQEVNFGTNDEFKVATAIGADDDTTPTNAPYDVEDDYLWIGTPVVNQETGEITGVVAGSGFVTGESYTDIFGYDDDRVKLQREEGNNAGNYALTVTNVGELGNYVFTAGASAIYKIKAIGGVQVWANTAHSAYKATPATLSAEIVGIATADMSETLQEAVDASLYVDVNGNGVKDEADDVTTANAGVYTIKFNQTDLAAAFANMPNYNVESIAQFTANYTVDRAEVTVKALPQVRMIGEKVIEDASAATIAFEGTAPTGNDLDLIYGTLKLGYTLPNTIGEDDPTTATIDESEALNAQKELCIAALTHGKAKADATHASDWDSEDGVWYDGIVITEASFEAYNAANAANATATAIKNYTLVLATVNKAELTVTTDEVVTFLGNLADNTTTLAADGAYAGKRLNVKIDKIGVSEFKAGTWYMLSLPFAITPFEFCNDIDGYAIFDRLSTSGDALSFKISMDPIPAYTPFLVKFEKAFKMVDKTFKKVNVEAAKIVETEANNTWKVVNTVDNEKHLGYVAWLEESTTGGIQIAWNYDTTEGTLQRGFRGYITTVSGDQPAARPVIYIEEPDGSTTAISSITADGQALKAEGWYTLNGVKLQSMPTEKGVYINNGKKVVLK